MPNLIALLKVRQKLVVPIAVSVADDSYTCHCLFLWGLPLHLREHTLQFKHLHINGGRRTKMFNG